jgi:hypothetical protein
MPLIKGVEQYAILVTLQVNAEGHDPVTIIIPQSKALKMLRRVQDAVLPLSSVPMYTSILDLVQKSLQSGLFAELDRIYQDSPTAEEVLLQEQAAAIETRLKAARAQRDWMQPAPAVVGVQAVSEIG